MMNQNQNDMNAFKYCRIKKKKGFNGYGFNLQSKSDAKCRYVGIVDACSPACLANLKNGDYIVEVNNVNVENLNHDEIVKLIKAGLKINEHIYKEEVLLTIRNNISTGESLADKKHMRQFREPNFLKNLNFDSKIYEKINNVYKEESRHKSSKSLDTMINKRAATRLHLNDENVNDSNEAEVVIFI